MYNIEIVDFRGHERSVVGWKSMAIGVAFLALSSTAIHAQKLESGDNTMIQTKPQPSASEFSTSGLSAAQAEKLAKKNEVATMLSLTEVVGSSVALLAGVSTCDETSDLAYTGSINQNEWTTQITGTYANRPVTLDYKGDFGAIHGLGQYKGTGAFGHETWTAAGTMSLSPESELMSLNGGARIGIVDTPLEFEANWLISKDGNHEVANAMTIVKKQRRPVIIIVIQGTWRHNTYWMHSVTIDIFTFKTASGQPVSCRVNIKESGDQTAKGQFRVSGNAKVARRKATLPRLRSDVPMSIIE